MVLTHYSQVYSQSHCLNGKVSSEFCGHSTNGNPKHKWLNRFWEKTNNVKLERWQTMMSSGCDAVPLKRPLQQEWRCIILQMTQQIQQTPQSNQSRTPPPQSPQKENYPKHINYHYIKQDNLIKCNDRENSPCCQRHPCLCPPQRHGSGGSPGGWQTRWQD